MYKTADEAIYNERIEVARRGFIDFDGKNCEDFDIECAGWDGVSRRCECGNRRVSWVAKQAPDGTFTAHGEAY